MSLYYFCPVYLLGSCLERENYNDVDLFIVLPDNYFNLRYGGKEGFMLRLGRDMEKRWFAGCTETGLNLDLKILPKTAFLKHYPADEKLRLDSTGF